MFWYISNPLNLGDTIFLKNNQFILESGYVLEDALYSKTLTLSS